MPDQNHLGDLWPPRPARFADGVMVFSRAT